MTDSLISLTGDAGIIFRDGLIKHLSSRVLRVDFIKKDGTPRTMDCTRSGDIIPFNSESDAQLKSQNVEIICVWDLGAKAKDGSAGDWRAIRIDSITNVSFLPA